MDRSTGRQPNTSLLQLTTFLFQVYTASRAAGFEHQDAMKIVEMSFTWMMNRGQQKKDQEPSDLDEALKKFFPQEGGATDPPDDAPNT